MSPFTLSKCSNVADYLNANKAKMDIFKTQHPEIIPLSAQGQNPHTLWIGCSDSRVNECVALGCLPGEVFTLRNIANILSSSDLTSMSAIQFAVEALKVSKVVVCGHTDCGGVRGSLTNNKTGGPLDMYLLPIRDLRYQYAEQLKNLSGKDLVTRLVELNVKRSVDVIRHHPSFVEAHEAGKVDVYGLIYDVGTGYLRELTLPESKAEQDLEEKLFDLKAPGQLA